MKLSPITLLALGLALSSSNASRVWSQDPAVLLKSIRQSAQAAQLLDVSWNIDRTIQPDPLEVAYLKQRLSNGHEPDVDYAHRQIERDEKGLKQKEQIHLKMIDPSRWVIESEFWQAFLNESLDVQKPGTKTVFYSNGDGRLMEVRDKRVMLRANVYPTLLRTSRGLPALNLALLVQERAGQTLHITKADPQTIAFDCPGTPGEQIAVELDHATLLPKIMRITPTSDKPRLEITYDSPSVLPKRLTLKWFQSTGELWISETWTLAQKSDIPPDRLPDCHYRLQPGYIYWDMTGTVPNSMRTDDMLGALKKEG